MKLYPGFKFCFFKYNLYRYSPEREEAEREKAEAAKFAEGILRRELRLRATVGASPSPLHP